MRDRAFAIQTYQELHTPIVAELAHLFTAWSKAGTARFHDPEAAAHLFILTISDDTLLGRILGVEDAILDDAQIAQRLEPFFAYHGLT